MGSIFRISTLLALAVAANTAYTSRAAATVGLASLLVNNGAVRECGSVILDSSLSMTLSNQGRSVVLKVAGECPICIASGIEMTEAAFTALGASERGSPTVTWFLD
ncbi:hypothetical protein B0H14DRAFT_3424306 [Mycena olivaceomarginata]|nr:hypothetical protein B0H14DRAFT_3424306 [Mycena olivaceomarginata]